MSVAELFDNTMAAGADPYAAYARARAEEPVFYSERYRMWFVTRHADIKAILKDAELFASQDRSIKPKSWPEPVAEIMARKRHAKHVGNCDPPEHTRLRQLLNPTFSPSRIAAQEPMIRQIADELLDQFSAPADLLADYTYPLPLRVIANIIGIPDGDVPHVHEICKLKAGIDFASEKLTLEQQIEGARGAVGLQDYCDELVQQRVHNPQDDLVSSLLATRVRGHQPMTAHEISDLLPILIFAGHETTANLLGNLLRHLLDNPEQYRQLRNNPEEIPQAVEEALRYCTPALGFVRRVKKEVELSGVTILEGSKVYLLFGSGNHDERIFENSEKFHYPRPQASNHFGFGFGIHFCVGAPLARLEARVALEQLLSRFPSLELADPDSVHWNVSLVLHTLNRLPVTWAD